MGGQENQTKCDERKRDLGMLLYADVAVFASKWSAVWKALEGGTVCGGEMSDKNNDARRPNPGWETTRDPAD